METTNLIIHSFIYLAFFLASWMAKKGKFNRLIKDDGALTENLLKLILFHFFGIFLLGYIQIVLVDSEVGKMFLINRIYNPYLIFGYALFFVFLLLFAIKQAKKDYLDRINHTYYSIELIVCYFITRALFLAVYEIWFRGFLLSDCISSFGAITAVFINLFLYVFIHLLNGKKEMLACIPFGLLVCMISIIFNAVWPAILLHVGFSLFYEITFYKLNLNHFKTVSS